MFSLKIDDPVKSQLSMAKKKVHQSYKIGKASQILQERGVLFVLRSDEGCSALLQLDFLRSHKLK